MDPLPFGIESPSLPDSPFNFRRVMVPEGKIGVFSFKIVSSSIVSFLHFTVVFRSDVSKVKQEEIIKSLSSHSFSPDSPSMLFNEGSVPNSYEIFWTESHPEGGDIVVKLLETKGLYNIN